MHGTSGETVNRGTIDTNLHIWLGFGGEETGWVYQGKWQIGARLQQQSIIDSKFSNIAKNS